LVQNAPIKEDKSALLPHVIAVSSGKGGVGKSSITINLAISLAKSGAKVCVLDADTGLANANILLGLTPQFSLEHVLFGAKAIEDVMLDGPHGMKIVPGANGISECVSLAPRQQMRLTRELARIEHNFDYLLIDTAAGIASTTLDFVSASCHALIVITPEPTSLTDAFSLIKLLARRPGAIYYHVVVNMCADGKQGKQVFNRFNSAVNKYIGTDIHYLGFIPLQESMRSAVTSQSPVATLGDSDPASLRFSQLAQNLLLSGDSLPQLRSFSAYWHRQFRKQGQSGPGGADTAAIRSVPVLAQSSGGGDELDRLGSHLLALVNQPQADTEALTVLFEQLLQAFNRRHGQLPLDLPGLVTRLIEEVNNGADDSVIVQVAQLLDPWLRRQPSPSVPFVVAAGSVSELPIEDPTTVAEAAVSQRQCHDGAQYKSATALTTATHCYRSHQFDSARFGSQQQLLQLLRSQDSGEQSLAALLAVLS